VNLTATLPYLYQTEQDHHDHSATYPPYLASPFLVSPIFAYLPISPFAYILTQLIPPPFFVNSSFDISHSLAFLFPVSLIFFLFLSLRYALPGVTSHHFSSYKYLFSLYKKSSLRRCCHYLILVIIITTMNCPSLSESTRLLFA